MALIAETDMMDECHRTPKQQKTHCRAAGLGSQWDVTGTLGNPRFEL